MSNQTTWTDDAGGIFNANRTTPLPVSLPSSGLPTGGASTTQGASGAASVLQVTIVSAVGKTAYVSGFSITGAGATAASVVGATLTGLIASNHTYKIAVPAGATVGITPLIVTFNPPIPASATNTNIQLSVPSFGAGNTDAAASIWGYVA